MTLLLRKNLLFFTSSHSTFQPRKLLLRLQLCEFSSSSTPYSHWKRQDEESRTVRVSVWWDFENCGVPAGVNVSRVAPAITNAVRANGIKGPVHITAFGDVLQLSRPNQEALAFTGIHLSHIPNGGKNSADRSLLVDLMYWVSQNPPPAHLFLISGDRDFAGILHRLRMNNYNILLAIPGKAPDVLCSASTIMWQWSSLLKGENLTGKHFNHPPDGHFGSWYGNSKVPLENPFSAAEQSPSPQKVQIVEINEPSSDLKSAGGEPKSVIRIIKHILNLHPNGISISDLRAELTKCNVSLGRNVFGYKRLYRFLSSIPNVHLQNVGNGNGNFCVKLLPSEFPEPSESSTTLSTASAIKNEERGYTTTPKLHSEDKDMDKDEYRSPLYSLQEGINEDDSKSFQSSPSQERPIEEDMPHESSIHSEKVVDVSNAQLSESQLSPKDIDDSKTEIGSFKVRSNKLFDDDIVRSEDVSPKVLEEYTNSGNPAAGIDHTMVENNDIASYESGKSMAKNKHGNQPRKEVDDQSRYSSAADDSLVEKRPDGCVETFSKRSTFFSWIRSWWPFWKSNAKADGLTAHHNKVTSNFEDSKSSELNHTASNLEEPKPLEPHQDVSHSGKLEDSKLSELDQTANKLEEPKRLEPHQDVNQSGKPVLFSSGSFWNDMESFVFSPKGSLLFSQSRSREDLAHKLQKYQPVVLKSLTKNDIFQLVELLIAEKKWLEESPSQPFPFKLTRSVQKSVSGLSNGSNDLISLFVSRTSHSNLQKSFENDGEKHTRSIQQMGVPRLATEKKHTKRSRSGSILQDCQKLVTDILREHPEGYNIGCLRRQFNDRYGYELDLKKLGYKKMVELIQTMPGVKVESCYMYPSDSETSILKTLATNASHEKFNSDSELSDTAPKEDNMESPWEELGPVSAKNLGQNDLKSNLSQKAIELDTPKNPDYEPVVLDYDSSDTEEDSSCLTQPKDQGKPKYDEQDSSFWQALDSWHSTKEEENRVHKSEDIVNSSNSLHDILDSSTESKEEENRVHKSENIVKFSNALLDILDSSTESKQGVIVSKNTSGNYRQKQRSQKYSFVADPDLPNKDKLFGDESKMQN
ncbi:hypothetical protein TSUD_179200 [Trifolium subterraneum]|uniref:HTH OST-type domain-containing protein n=1 Tax=Trifolium subterraneum TaxID=3900 RepID=A0A2Z6M2W6_TRISU|nr:hypothetical protein TSUD_179200 [Trifolium subterraneum]